MWNGGRYMHYGEPLDDDRFPRDHSHRHDRGIRTFLTADVYGTGAADEMLGRALAGLPRDAIVSSGRSAMTFTRVNAKAPKVPSIHRSALRTSRDYVSYLRMATEKSLETLRHGSFRLFAFAQS
jgi:aryl-alcohol dehydrogenase-like predicted oxidoreductase